MSVVCAVAVAVAETETEAVALVLPLDSESASKGTPKRIIQIRSKRENHWETKIINTPSKGTLWDEVGDNEVKHSRAVPDFERGCSLTDMCLSENTKDGFHLR